MRTMSPARSFGLFVQKKSKYLSDCLILEFYDYIPLHTWHANNPCLARLFFYRYGYNMLIHVYQLTFYILDQDNTLFVLYSISNIILIFHLILDCKRKKLVGLIEETVSTLKKTADVNRFVTLQNGLYSIVGLVI